ncbi:hypothetical protein ACFL1D_03585 [Candidatus Omnitrophota bacterium]
MKIKFLKDNLWVVGLIVAALLFLNIFIQRNDSGARQGKQFYSYQELNADKNKMYASLNPAGTGFEPSLNLSLELLGTVIGNPTRAIISFPESGKYALYSVGETVAGARIVGIAEGKVLLEKGGLLQELLLKQQAVSVAAADSGKVIEEVSENEMIVSRSGVISQMDQAKELLAKVKILPMPDVASGGLEGFRIDDVPEGSIIERAGIKSGDIVSSVAGQRLRSTQDVMHVFSSFRSQPIIEVEVLRDGQPLTLRYRLRD